MKLIGIRFCQVADQSEAADLSSILTNLGLAERDLGMGGNDTFQGAIFPTNDGASWVEIWAAGEGFEAGTMLQLIVDDADAFAQHARENGLDPQGPTDAHGERIYYLRGPRAMPISFQSKL